MKKLLVIAAILAVLAVLALVGWRVYRKIAEAEGLNRRGGVVVAVVAEPVRRQTIRDVAEFTGTVLSRSQFVVAPKVPGRLEKLLVNIGQAVSNGDLIAVLDSEEYAQQAAQAGAELDVSQANLTDCRSSLDVAGREFQRAKELREQKVAAEADLDEAEARYRAAEAKYQVAEAQIKQKQAALNAAKVRLSYTRIHATWQDGDGARLIAERFVDEGAMLRANDPIVSVVDVSSVIAAVHVIERDFPAVRVGQTATVVTDAYEDRRFTGLIVRKAPVLKEESRQARVEIEIPNVDGLLAPGMFVRALIEFDAHEDTTVVPLAALVRRGGRQGVFLADTKAMLARFVPIKVGIVSGEAAEVLEPKLAGMVVTLGHHLLEDGGSIRLPEVKPAADEQPTTRASKATGRGPGGSHP